MQSAVNNFEDILNILGIDVVEEPQPEENNFKLFVIDYVQDHDGLESNHQVIGQLHNLNNVNDIEQILRQTLDYCDDCVLNLFRKFASGGKEEQQDGCPCEGDDIKGDVTTIIPVGEIPPGGG